MPAQGRNGLYYTVNGTSPACALVAGVAALIKSKYPAISPAQVMEALTTTAQQPMPGGGYNVLTGFGIVDADAALIEAGKLTRERPAGTRVALSTHFGGGAAAIPAAPVAPRGPGPLVVFALLARRLAGGRGRRAGGAAAAAATMDDELDDYSSRVLDVVDAIPPGQVMSYGDIAEYLEAGGPRQVGRVLASYGGGVAWWRVIHADGTPAPGHDAAALAQLPGRGDAAAGGAAHPAGRAGPGRHAPGPLVGRPGEALNAPRMSVGAWWNAILMNGYRLVRRAPSADPPAPPVLDEAQQRVVDHKGGPLLVLAGPGTGKTTTIVAAVAERIERRGIDPSRILVLTFSRKAAGELRDRITARLGRTTSAPLALTFHSYAYALVRREFVLAGDQPPRLLSAPEQLLEIRRLLRGEIADGARDWPERLRPALATRGFAEELRDVLMRAAERGLDGKALRQLGRRCKRDDWVAAGAFLDRYSARFDLAPVPAYDYAEIVRIAAGLLGAAATRQRERDAYDAVFVDEYQDCDPAQEALLQALAGDGRDLVAVGDPDQSIYAFRGADVRVLTSFPDRFRGPDGTPAPVIALRTCRRSGPVLLAASRRIARRLPAAPRRAATPAMTATGVAPRARRPARGGPAGEVRICVADTQAQEAAVVADTLRRAHLADGVPWGRMAVLVRSAPAAGAVAAAGARGGRGAGDGGGGRTAAARRAGRPPAAHAAALRACGRTGSTRRPRPNC